ncbi:chromosome segregation protein SMC, partial [Rubellimicrobium sp. CFH 75288]|nr:chromosome segregation protein SMC [Rubellimicrobium sp. CFH 75288]
ALAEATARLAEAEERAAALPDPAAARQAAREATAALSAVQAAFGSARAAEDRLRRAADGRRRRLAELAREAEGWETRRQVAADRAGDLAARRRAAEAALAAAEAEPAGLRERRHAAEHAAEAAAAAARDAAEVLRAAEADLRDAAQAEREADRRVAEAREALARAEALRLAAAGSAAEALRRLGETTGLGPAALLDRLGGDAGAIPPAEALRATIDDLRRRRDALGAVNLRAEEDARALAAEHEALMRERADCEAAVAELRRALSALNREGRERMRAAFERVDAEFARLFRHLFGGGEARLALVEGDDPLEAGVEIMARPPGKTLGTLSLLSGGEQTLTALALIFAVFLVAPAPVCVLDEVDAPLDDANVGRFCDLLEAMARETETRFLVITHHAVTMARMDRLFGVTMAERGVSQLVSVDLRAAEAMVA